MALFTNAADRGLPLLTHLYQLERSDLETFLCRWTEAYSPYSRSVALPDDPEQAAEALSRVWDYVTFVQRIMAAVADKKASPADLLTLEALIAQYVRPQVITLPVEEWGDGAEWEAYYGSAPERDSDKPEASKAAILDPLRWHEYLKRQTVYIIMQSIQAKAFYRCPVCNSVYQRTRGNQRYCSERCGYRQRKRRVREKVHGK